MESEIVELGQHDLSELRRLSLDTFIHAFGTLNTRENLQAYLTQAFSWDQLQKELGNPHSYFYFIQSGKVRAGYMKLNTAPAQTDLKDEDGLEIERIYVQHHFQGAGLGAKLLLFAMETARKMQKKFIWLGVWEHNTGAIRFYQRHGFYEFDRHPFMLGDDRQIDLLLRYDL